MNTEHALHKKSGPGAVCAVIISLIGAVLALIVPYLGLIAAVALAGCTAFLASSKAPLPVAFIPVLGIVGVFFISDILTLLIVAGVFLAAVISGVSIRYGGDFHRGLMTFILVSCAAAVVCAFSYMSYAKITPEMISDAVEIYVRDYMTYAIESMGDSLSLEAAETLAGQYEAIAAASVMYIPAVIGGLFGIIGLVSLRLAGFIHTLTYSDSYPIEKRIAVPDRVFAVIYIVSVIIGMGDMGVVGASLLNIMIIMTVPACAAGVSAYRILLLRRRLSGRRGLPLSLVMLIFSFVFFTPAVGLMILSLTGVFSAFGKRRKKK